MSGSGPTSTSTTTNPYQQNWQDLIGNVSNLTGGGAGTLPVYGGPTVAPLSANQLTAADMARQFATAGTAAGNAGNSAITQIAGGMMNPFLNDVVNQSNQKIADVYGRTVAPATDAAAARAGSFGGSGYMEQVGANQRNLADALAANTSGLLSGQFNTDIGQRLAAAGLSQGSQAADLNAISALQGTGAMQQGNTQAILDAMQQQFGQSVSSQFTPAQILASILGQAQGNTTTTYQGPGTNPLISGGALAAYLASQWL